MEGVSGIVRQNQSVPGTAEYPKARESFMSELTALVEGLLSGGAGGIVIYDEHYYGRNIDPYRLPRGTRAISGKPPYRPDWPGGLDPSFAGVILHGFHSKQGTRHGLLNHSYEPDIADLDLNGVSVGEIGIEASIAGDLSVPAVMIIGDSAGVAEARALLPGIVCVSVKKSISATAAVCYPLSKNVERIRTAAEQLVGRPPAIEPYSPGRDVSLKITLNNGPYLAAVSKLFSGLMSGDNVLLLKGNSTIAVWSEYWQIKLRAQAAMIQEQSSKADTK